MQSIYTPKVKAETREAIYNLFAAYLHTIPLEDLIKSVERAQLDAKLRYMVIYGAACSYCLGRAKRLEGSYLRTFALELKEQLALTLTVFVTSILAGSRAHLHYFSGHVGRRNIGRSVLFTLVSRSDSALNRNA
ncbi:MAG: hypothetical protein WCE82_05835 [Halobacteriota archaeon]